MNDDGKKCMKLISDEWHFFQMVEQSFLVETTEHCHFLIAGLFIPIHVMLHNEMFKNYE